MSNNKKSLKATPFYLFVALGITTVSPLLSLTPASAQLFPTQQERRNTNISSTVIIPTGTEIPLQYEKEKILLTKRETIPVTLTVAANIRDRFRNTLIPFGTEVKGEIRPDNGGSRFVAEELIFADGTRQLINASSSVVSRTEVVNRGTDTDDILKGAAIGAAAAAVLGEVFGDINIEEVIGGAGLGALGGWLFGGKNTELISIDPNRDLDITLDSDLVTR